MKRAGKHPTNALSAAFVRTTTMAGRHADGNGLYLMVNDNGAKRWVLRTLVLGTRKDIGLGSARLVTLADARTEATRLRKIAREGGDPLAERRSEKIAAITFDQAAVIVRDKLQKNSATSPKPWTDKHAEQWLKSVQDHASPVLGNLRVGVIKATDIYRAMDPIWQTKAVTAARVLSRIEATMNWAKANGHRTGDNPVDEARTHLGKQLHAPDHQEAIPYSDIPKFYAGIDGINATLSAKLALRFLILNANRTSEVRFARVSELDLENKCWEIPGERMKSRRPHRIPLSDEAVEVAREALKLPRVGDYLFTGQDPGEPMSRDALLKCIKKSGLPATTHGCRSSFKDWSSEEGGFPDELSEMALAHAVKDRTVKAYKRGDLFDRRRALMDAWAGYLTGASSNVVQLRSAN